jgi:hypothetical protein
MSLDEIGDELAEFYKRKWLENKKDLERFDVWKDEKSAVKKLTDILGFYPGDHPDVMVGVWKVMTMSSSLPPMMAW